MYKTILVPLDGSKRAEAILPHVEEIARHFAAKIIFMQVVESHIITTTPYGAVMLDTVAFEQETIQAKAYLTSLCNKFREKGIEATQFVEHSSIVETIIAIAAREGADLIAMASHGRGGLSRVFYGSIAAGVLQQVDRPLLLIRAHEHA
jgi:nucleotide-binding universal stress UspA family protein